MGRVSISVPAETSVKIGGEENYCLPTLLDIQHSSTASSTKKQKKKQKFSLANSTLNDAMLAKQKNVKYPINPPSSP